MAHAYEGRPIDVVLRAMDIVIASAVLVLLGPLVLLVALATLITTGTPVLYRGDRVGRAGRVFTMYKFRTLAADAESRLGPYLGKELTRRTEAELTGIGRALRPTHLDEVPQLLNVVRGDMSIVGPRPVRPLLRGALRAYSGLLAAPGRAARGHRLRADEDHPRGLLG